MIENEMDIRIESLVSDIHKYREEFKVKLSKSKEYFERFVLIFQKTI